MMKKFFKTLYRLLTSTKLTIIILFVLIFFMLLGTILPQGGTSEEYIRAFGTTLHSKLAPFGVLDIFHSWYFITAGILLYINLFLGTLKGFLLERRKTALLIDKPRGAMAISVAGGFSAVEDALKKRGFRYRKLIDDDNATAVIGVRGLRKRYVSLFFHFFLGISIIGFVLSAMTKFDGYIDFKIGDKEDIPLSSQDMGVYRVFKEFNPDKVDKMEVELKNYEMEYILVNERYFPKDYKSTLIARYNGMEKMKVVEVNRPLKLKGLTLYQMGYSQRFDLDVGDSILHLEAGESFSIDGIDGMFLIRTIYAGKLFEGEEVIDIVPNTKLYYRGMDGPGWENIAKLTVDEPVTVMGKSLVLRNVKEVSGIYYKRDDGVPLLYISFFLFLVGMFVRIFFPCYELRLFYDKKEQTAYMKGTASGVAAYIDREINEIEKMVRQSQ
ncbi:cytochrome c biogenesis protein ResB [candidate division WOR-3 bacterium]|nr:cytochrome c biogenesis protein ResB [candidate division WOR-3 bacterium]